MNLKKFTVNLPPDREEGEYKKIMREKQKELSKSLRFCEAYVRGVFFPQVVFGTRIKFIPKKKIFEMSDQDLLDFYDEVHCLRKIMGMLEGSGRLVWDSVDLELWIRDIHPIGNFCFFINRRIPRCEDRDSFRIARESFKKDMRKWIKEREKHFFYKNLATDKDGRLPRRQMILEKEMK